MKTQPRFLTGLSLTELLVAMVVVALVMAGAAGVFFAQNRVAIQEEISVTMERNLRIGIRHLTDSIRNAGFDTPKTNLATWVPWVAGFAANPNIVAGGSASTPDAISVARCTAQAVTALTANAAVAATILSVASTSALDSSERRLINIGHAENAHVVTVNSATSITVDTNPITPGLQGLAKARPANTSICRVDVDTYRVDASEHTLLLDHNDGNAAKILLDGILNLKVVRTGSLHEVVLTVQSDRPDPATDAILTRAMRSSAAMKN